MYVKLYQKIGCTKLDEIQVTILYKQKYNERGLNLVVGDVLRELPNLICQQILHIISGF